MFLQIKDHSSAFPASRFRITGFDYRQVNKAGIFVAFWGFFIYPSSVECSSETSHSRKSTITSLAKYFYIFVLKFGRAKVRWIQESFASFASCTGFVECLILSHDTFCFEYCSTTSWTPIGLFFCQNEIKLAKVLKLLIFLIFQSKSAFYNYIFHKCFTKRTKLWNKERKSFHH